MKFDAPFLFLRDLVTDVFRAPRAFYHVVRRYQNQRSHSHPVGSLPLADIFEFVPDAAERIVHLQGIFEVPMFPRGRPCERERFTASTTLADSFALALLTQKAQPRRVLEVGTSFGQTALLFALNSPPECKITTLDTHAGNGSVGNVFRDRPAATKIELLHVDFNSLAKALGPAAFDVIFIDGDHRFDAVMMDSRLALDFIRPGGFILWHDYTFSFRHDVVKALDFLRISRGLDIRKLAYTNLAILATQRTKPSTHALPS